MPKYGIATLLENHPVGYEFPGSNAPLHLTHVDAFTVDMEEDELASRLQTKLAAVSSFAVRTLEDELFGPNKDIPVTILELSEPLKELHYLLLQFLEDEGGALKNPHFHGDSFAPHVSIYGARRIQPGTEVLIKDVSIGSKISEGDNPIHKILATIPLK